MVLDQATDRESHKVVFDQNGNPVAIVGLITSTQTTSRQIQFALKLLW
jgi:hypothetical protein